jgi:hypothetical protein
MKNFEICNVSGLKQVKKQRNSSQSIDHILQFSQAPRADKSGEKLRQAQTQVLPHESSECRSVN